MLWDLGLPIFQNYEGAVLLVVWLAYWLGDLWDIRDIIRYSIWQVISVPETMSRILELTARQKDNLIKLQVPWAKMENERCL